MLKHKRVIRIPATVACTHTACRAGTQLYRERMSNFLDWLSQLAHAKTGSDQTQSSIARAIDVSPSTVNRWKNGVMPDDKAMRAISRVYGVSMPAVLVHAGYMTEEEAQLTTVEVTRRLTNSELVEEISARLRVDKPTHLRSVDQVPAVDDDAPPPFHLAEAARTEPGYIKSGDREPDE